MAHGNEKGIVLKLQAGEGEVHLHPESLNTFLSALPKDDRGWVVLKATLHRNSNPKRYSSSSHRLAPAKPQYRQTKIVGPTHYKQAG